MIVLAKETNSTRQIILNMLKRNQELTVATIATELGVTEMAVRRHLQGLEHDGLIKSRLLRQAMGRPTHIYSLTEKGDECFPRNYSDLSLGILQDVEQMGGSQMVDRLFEQRRDRLQRKYEADMNGSFSDRIEALALIQSENGYMVEYKQLEDGSYEFIEYNCPISQVAKEFPIACNCEQQLFKKLLETDGVERESCIAKENTSCCVYKLKEKSSS